MASPRPVIVGTGIAGLWTAWRLVSEGHPVVLVTKETLADSASSWAQGGIAVALGPGDSPSQHAADTLAASDGLADPEAVRILTSEGPDRVYELLALGAVFDRGPDGKLGFGLEAAHTRPRIIHSGGDRTGAALIGCLAQVVRHHPGVELLEHTEVTGLLTHDGTVRGVAILRRGQAGASIPASAVILATGGVGQLYAVTTNPKVATADGWALAHRIGAKLRDIEFLQFHPTALKLPGAQPGAADIGGRQGAGAVLLDRAGHRFALESDPRGELAPRDIVARAVAAADAAGGAWLDARSVNDLPTRFPGITAMLLRYGLDPARDLLPVAPALHYAMGGIQTDLQGRTTKRGLWAVGEVARTGSTEPTGWHRTLCSRAWCSPTGLAGRWQAPWEGDRRRERPGGCGRQGQRRRRRVRDDPRGNAKPDDRERRAAAERGLSPVRRGRTRAPYPCYHASRPGGPTTSCWSPGSLPEPRAGGGRVGEGIEGPTTHRHH